MSALNRHGRVLEHGRLGAPPGFFAVHHLWNHRGRNLDMVTVYPPGFPIARPEIRLNNPADRPRGHCDPTNGNLCYLAHHRHAWQPQRLVANYIEERLPMILDGHAAGEGEPVAEPAENWWNAIAVVGSILVVESDWALGAADAGTMSLRTAVGRGRPPAFRCLADAVMDAAGDEVARRRSALPLEFTEAVVLRVPWRLFDRELRPDEHLRVLDETLAGAPRRGIVRLHDRYVRIAVAVCPTEVAHGRTGLSWIFLVQTGDRKALEQGRGASIETRSARTLRAGPNERRSRSPSAAALDGRTIAVIGLGAIGAPVALDLARNGAATVAMGDHDIVTPGNAVRWPLGESAWGSFKVDALARHLAHNHAGVAAPVSRRMFGDIDLNTPQPDDEGFVDAIKAAHLLVDCTATGEAERLLFDQARAMGVPLISAYGTATLGGGVVACFAPGGACPMCLLHHRKAGTLAPPPGEEGDAHAVQLPGCAEATFAGASHDLEELSMQAVRIAVRALAKPPTISFVETLSFDEDRRPQWRLDRIDRHPDCDCG